MAKKVKSKVKKKQTSRTASKGKAKDNCRTQLPRRKSFTDVPTVV